MFKKPIVVMLSGRAGTGKSTSARILNEIAKKEGLESTVASFSSPLKMIATSMGWDGKKDERGRRLLQRLGTDVGREYDDDMWCKLLFNWIEQETIYDVIFIDDWRFLSEYKFVRNRFPYAPISIRLIAPDREELINTENYNHISETSLPIPLSNNNRPNYDFLVYNTKHHILDVQLATVWLGIKNNLEYYYTRGEKTNG